MDRRRALTAIGAVTVVTAWAGASTLAAERQWKRGTWGDLILHADDQDPGSIEIAEILSKQLRTALPDSGARVARDTAEGLDAAMSSTSGDLAVVAYHIALEMYHGHPPYRAAGPIALRVVVENYKYQVVCPASWVRDRAYVVAEALMKDPEPLKLTIPDRPPGTASRDTIPTHPGALAFLKGEALETK